MYPIAARFRYFFLYSYTLLLGAGVLAGLLLTAWLARQRPAPGWFDAALIAWAGAMLGGRAAFIGGQWGYFQERPSEIWQLWQGGLSYHGALLGGLLGVWLWCGWQKRNPAPYLSLLAPAFVLLNSFGWAACWMDGCAYGAETGFGLLSADLPDKFGIYARRYQSQLVGLGLSLALLPVILGAAWRRRDANIFWWALLGVSAGRVVVTLLRGDPVYQVGAWRIDTLLDIALAIISWLLLQYHRQRE